MEKTSQDSRTTSDQSTGSEAASGKIEPIAKPQALMPEIANVEFALGEMAMQEDAAASAGADATIENAEVLQMVEAQLPGPQIDAGENLIESLSSIPEKMAFKIGEAAEMVGVKQYVLRYWESEFDMLRPRKSKNNQRVYSRRDVETAMMIKKLLYNDRFSIEGARTALRQLKSQVKEERSIHAMAQSQESAVTKLQGLVAEIRRIREIFM
jgi:DNA-binding transcriptional MerR regulator